jgi:hypothetical protein
MTEPLDESTGLSRRSALKRIGAGAAIAWSAPAMMSVARSAGAGSAQPCDCNPGVPCNLPIGCNGQGPGGACNCWVRVDGNGCWCGPLDACINHAACTTNDDCAAGEVCVTNCCGQLCYPACPEGAAANAADVRLNPQKYGLHL